MQGLGLRALDTVMENQMRKNIENETQAGTM